MTKMRFHWMLPKGGETNNRETARVLTTETRSLAGRPDIDGWLTFARAAEAAGIEAVLMSFGNYEPDTLMTACALGMQTDKLKYIAAYRLGLMQPASFVQQINTISTLIGGRIALNVIAGSSPAEQHGYGDYLEHDERYARAEEYLAICNRLWRGDGPVDFDGRYYRIEGGGLSTPFRAPDRAAPEIYVAGHSDPAIHLATAQGTCWLRLADSPEKLRPMVSAARRRGVEVCLRLCVICRPTRKQAIEAAQALREDEPTKGKVRDFLAKSDSRTFKDSLRAAGRQEWLTSCLWTGLVTSYGASAMTLIGTPDEVAAAFMDYRRIGVTQFIVAGWPKLEEMQLFGREVLPRVREFEHRVAIGA